jgi:hypothetical protein
MASSGWRVQSALLLWNAVPVYLLEKKWILLRIGHEGMGV